MADIDIVLKEIREEQYPYFADGEVEYYLEKNKGNVRDTIYEMLLIKAENSAISVSGLSTNDMSNYFKRLASNYRPFNSGTLQSW